MSLAFIIDGYNLVKHRVLAGAIRKTTSGRQGTGSELASLIQIIRLDRLTGSARNRVTIVCDGYRPHNAPEPADPFEIVYSCDDSADDCIVRLVDKAGRPGNLVVVSDDRQIQAAAKMRGCSVLGVEEFCGRNAAKKKAASGREQEDTGKLSYSDMERINKELREKWLK